MDETQPGPQPPKGFSRFLYRLPILLYRVGLGILMGRRFLLLEHTGRRSGLPRNAVLEVIRFDRNEEMYYVVSAFGERADWYKNICKDPSVRIQVGWKWKKAQAQLLDVEKTEKEILVYARSHPKVFRVLVERLLGYEVGEGEDELMDLARKFIVVGIRVDRK
jgi:deazaflavin-dependent oxidoreductase (nitroreductase family)